MKMKKYLMTGIAALALCAGFTSCSHDVEGYTSLKEAKTAEYNAAFIQTFGKPAANQDWGFTRTSTSTRAGSTTIDVNGNMWKTKPEVTPAEAKAVYEYVNMTLAQMIEEGHEFTTDAPTDLSTYYCTQVWGAESYGKTYYNDVTKLDPNCLYLNATQMINAANGQNYSESEKIYGPNHMDNLHIAMTTEDGPISVGDDGVLNGYWEHIYNFNASKNTNFGGNTGVINGGTIDFAYMASEDSKYHKKWIIIDGDNIVDEDGVRHTGKSYVCFDFIATHPEVVTKFHGYFWNPYDNGGNWNYVGPIEKPGFYTLETAADLTITLKMRNPATNQEYDVEYPLVNDDADATENKVKGLVVESYDKGNFCVEANDIYTDWIIRLVDAQPSSDDDPVVESGRIFCEDLGGIGDFDFNDVVFDAKIYQSGKIDIEVFAAGGTLPISVAGTPITIGKMKNTGEGSAPHQFIYVTAEQAATNGWAHIINIPIVVSQTNAANEVESYELQANIGQVPQKICVPLGTPWVDEYINIEKAYPSFKAYVAGTVSKEACWANYVEKYVNLDLTDNND